METPGGRVHIRWDFAASATSKAQLAFFAEFLTTTGVYDRWVKGCTLSYTRGNASHKRDVLGTWFLSILAGHHGYAHITALRGDGVSAQILDMRKMVIEDKVRRALARLSADQSRNWLRSQLLASVQPALDSPWILDIDTTIKTLFGQQSGCKLQPAQAWPAQSSFAYILHEQLADGSRCCSLLWQTAHDGPRASWIE